MMWRPRLIESLQILRLRLLLLLLLLLVILIFLICLAHLSTRDPPRDAYVTVMERS